ncbi:hypothetical protein CIPAW_07G052600 [Carya illinoinensis]|uniref:Uncharacterized protein n=1 Tax=Carya illinoinensis TaxID=32201 RepID=A0A8T1PZ15_CARIL|nr:hypothetical protein CIPAW_07G052600 [Carya illinoinensis]
MNQNHWNYAFESPRPASSFEAWKLLVRSL